MLTVKPRLNEVIKELGITQMKLAEMTGIPQGTISRFDKNERHADIHVFVIARTLNVPVEALFEVTPRQSL